MKQEQILQIQIMEQEANQLNEHLKLIEQNISEMQELMVSLEEIEKKEIKEMLANIGKRIYIPVEIKNKKLIVDVGNQHFVKKTVPETKKVIDEQIRRLIAGKTEIMEKLGELQEKMRYLLGEMEEEQQKEQAKEKKN